LGDFAGGNFESEAHAISSDGTTVVGYGTVASGATSAQHAFRWTAAGGMQDLGDLPSGSDYSEAFGVNRDGTIVVGSSSTFTDPSGVNNRMTFKWTSGGGIQGLGYGYQTGYESGQDVSSDGSVIVGGANIASGNSIGYRWTSPGGFQTLVNQTNFSASSSAVSDDGNTVVGNSQPSDVNHAWIWTPGSGTQLLANLAGFNQSMTFGMSGNGNYVVGQATNSGGSECAVLWINGVPQAISPLASYVAYSVSDDGSVVVGSTGFNLPPFYWTSANGLQSLASVLALDQISVPAGWTLARVSAVSGDGLSMTGYGTDPAGHTEAWYAQLDPAVPEPGTGTLAIVLLLVVGSHRRRCRRGNEVLDEDSAIVRR